LASSVDDVYNYQTIFIRSGTGEDQTGLVIGYDGTTKIATIEGNWLVNPDSTTGYAVLPSFNNPTATNFSSFRNRVVIDSTSGFSGTIYPTGTKSRPVDNLADAKLIALRYGIAELEINNTFVVGASDDISDFTIEGSNPLSSVLVLTSGATTDKTTFKDMIVTGALNGPAFMERVGIQSLVNIGSDTFPSVFFECILRSGVNSFKSGLTTPQNIHFVNCTSGVPGNGTPTLDINNTASPFAIREYSGGINVINYTGGQDSTIEVDQGQIILDASCTSGNIRLGGIYDLTNNSILTINERNGSIADSVWDEAIANHLTAGSTGESLNNVAAGASPTTIADAVWDQLASNNVTVGSVGLIIAELQLKLDELHKLQGLDSGNPMTVTPTTRVSGPINLNLSGDGTTSTTVTRV
jgi:hypothetical protein